MLFEGAILMFSLLDWKDLISLGITIIGKIRLKFLEFSLLRL